MKSTLEHHGYVGSVNYSPEDRVFYGKIAHIGSLVKFEGSDVDSLEASFKEAVGDYLDTCQELGAGLIPRRSVVGRALG